MLQNEFNMKNFFKKLFNKKQYEIEKLEKQLEFQKEIFKEAINDPFLSIFDSSDWKQEIAELEDKLKKLKQ
jgi:hypothetical protein